MFYLNRKIKLIESKNVSLQLKYKKHMRKIRNNINLKDTK